MGVPRRRGARRHARRAPGQALGERLARLLPDLRARQPDLGAALGADPRRHPRPRRAVRARRVRRAARVAARAPAPARPQVHAGRDARARVGTTTIDPEPYVRYLRAKLGEIYGLPAVRRRQLRTPRALEPVRAVAQPFVRGLARVHAHGEDTGGHQRLRPHRPQLLPRVAAARRGLRARRVQRPRRRADDGAPARLRLAARAARGRRDGRGAARSRPPATS